ncbi:MAG TPA: HEAT repeat domain-containing protein [Nitrosopumilaceae archaeon]|nr:HEAT repeat domain-containing protein [Nitrosopumilaceae archaeon]
MRKYEDVYQIRELPSEERFEACKQILENEKDESLRWDAVWLAGETAQADNKNKKLFDQISNLMAFVLKNDNNSVVKHEACYQIAMRKMENKIPDLITSALYDDSPLVKHEAIEALGLLDAFSSNELISKSLASSNQDVKKTAEFVLRRLERIKNNVAIHA